MPTILHIVAASIMTLVCIASYVLRDTPTFPQWPPRLLRHRRRRFIFWLVQQCRHRQNALPLPLVAFVGQEIGMPPLEEVMPLHNNGLTPPAKGEEGWTAVGTHVIQSMAKISLIQFMTGTRKGQFSNLLQTISEQTLR